MVHLVFYGVGDYAADLGGVAVLELPAALAGGQQQESYEEGEDWLGHIKYLKYIC
jgi:hypothetical protein